MKQENNDKQIRMADLIAKFVKGGLSTEESEELEAWLEADPKNKELFAELNDPSLQKKTFEYFAGKDLAAGWEKVSLSIENNRNSKINSYRWWAIAATILLLFSISGWWVIAKRNNLQQKNVVTQSTGKEIYPGSYTATLIDGKGLSHNLLKNDKVAIEGYAVNTEDGLKYYRKNNVPDTNTLVVPPKGMFHMTLEDGTEVWLHPSSTLKYPVCFTGPQRNVTLTGEAYFKVAKNPDKPFRVHCNGVVTEAVGTEFNINGYEEWVTTSLVKGIVNIITKKGRKTLTAGNRLTTKADAPPQQAEKLDTSLAEGWKNGDFDFQETKLPEVMSALAEWYGIQIAYAGKYGWAAKTFTGKLPRNIPLGEVLQIIEMTGIAHFKVTDNTVYISSLQGR